MLAIVTRYAFETFELDWDDDRKAALRRACGDGDNATLGWQLNDCTSNMTDGIEELVVVDDNGELIYDGEL